ncbi:MAG: hypothetical protein K0V04_16060 [Deltaproteobacteria bacterium]|nr:hypothetical protein [Deltaproteobacteria bacterium]
MRLALVTAVCASLALGAVPAAASEPSTGEPRTLEVPADEATAVQQAEQAWGRGDWDQVRQLLDPVAADPRGLQDGRLREKALCLLADATINDLDIDERARREGASEHLGRLLDLDPDWRLPPAIYSPDLFELFVEIQDQRSKRSSEQYEADIMALQADLADSNAMLTDVRRSYEALKVSYQEQEVEVREQVARTRALAIFPFGIGHFYNREPVLGGIFLGTEAAVGITGLTLILYRTIADGCRREQGFQRGSLMCANRSLTGIRSRRRAEEAIGWVFIGAVAVDIFLAQYRFRPIKTESVKRVPRGELDAGGSGDKRRRRRGRKPRAKVRPTGGGGPHGVSLGVSVRF